MPCEASRQNRCACFFLMGGDLLMALIKNAGFKTLRAVVQFVIYFWEMFLVITDKAAFLILSLFFKPEYKKVGSCQKTGECCRAIGLEFPAFLARSPKVLHFFQKWHFLRYNFKPLGVVDNMLVYECAYLTSDNRCGIHWRKPKLCRDFPLTKLRGFPKLHKGCGYSFERVRPSPFDKILQAKRENHHDFDV